MKIKFKDWHYALAIIIVWAGPIAYMYETIPNASVKIPLTLVTTVITLFILAHREGNNPK